jgi:hypothetical protein
MDLSKCILFPTNLHRLILDYCTEIDSCALIDGIVACPQLDILSLYDCRHLKVKDVLHTVDVLPCLQSLNIKHTVSLNCDELEYILLRFPNINKLQFTPAHHNSAKWFQLLVKGPLQTSIKDK